MLTVVRLASDIILNHPYITHMRGGDEEFIKEHLMHKSKPKLANSKSKCARRFVNRRHSQYFHIASGSERKILSVHLHCYHKPGRGR